MTAVRRWLPFLLLVPVVAIALWVGAGRGDGRPGPAARADRLASEVRCPTCEGLSAAESGTPAAVAVRDEIRRRIDAGETDGQVRAFLVSRYGKDILLVPEGSGVAALVWALPVTALVLGGGGLVLALRRRRPARSPAPTPEDRALVEQALRDGLRP